MVWLSRDRYIWTLLFRSSRINEGGCEPGVAVRSSMIIFVRAAVAKPLDATWDKQNAGLSNCQVLLWK
jgi:hypothetical protein